MTVIRARRLCRVLWNVNPSGLVEHRCSHDAPLSRTTRCWYYSPSESRRPFELAHPTRANWRRPSAHANEPSPASTHGSSKPAMAARLYSHTVSTTPLALRYGPPLRPITPQPKDAQYGPRTGATLTVQTHAPSGSHRALTSTVIDPTCSPFEPSAFSHTMPSWFFSITTFGPGYTTGPAVL